MRPSRKAKYCEAWVSTCWPGAHSITLVWGSRVVSVWKGLPSTRPLKTTDFRSLMGQSGLVISVGLEKGGTSRSSRLLSGASGSSSSPAAANWAWVGWGTGVEPVESSPPPQPPISPATTVVPISAEALRALTAGSLRATDEMPMRAAD